MCNFRAIPHKFVFRKFLHKCPKSQNLGWIIDKCDLSHAIFVQCENIGEKKNEEKKPRYTTFRKSTALCGTVRVGLTVGRAQYQPIQTVWIGPLIHLLDLAWLHSGRPLLHGLHNRKIKCDQIWLYRSQPLQQADRPRQWRRRRTSGTPILWPCIPGSRYPSWERSGEQLYPGQPSICPSWISTRIRFRTCSLDTHPSILWWQSTTRSDSTAIYWIDWQWFRTGHFERASPRLHQARQAQHRQQCTRARWGDVLLEIQVQMTLKLINHVQTQVQM